MRTFTIEDQTYECPDIGVCASETDADSNQPVFEILEGEFKGTKFSFSNIRMDENDESLMWYDLSTSPECKDIDKIKPIADNFMVMILHDQLERLKNESGSNE